MAVGQGAGDLRRGSEQQRRLLVYEDGAPPLRGGGSAGSRRAQGGGGEGGVGGVRARREAGEVAGIVVRLLARRGARRVEGGGRLVQRVAALGARRGHVR